MELRNNSVLLIDAMSLIHRSYYAYPKLTSNDGRPTGALLGFVKYLKSFQDKYSPEHIIVCSDASRRSFRTDIYPEYKGNRSETDDDLRIQFGFMEEYLKKCNVTFIKTEGYEADDIIGTLAKESKKYAFNPYIVSGDRDMFQLVNNNVKQFYLSNKGVIYYDIEDVIKKYDGLTPVQLADFKALAGDTSDNIPGVKGIGEKTAIKLLNEFKDLDGIYKNIDSLKGKQRENIKNEKELAYLYKKLTTIYCDIELDFNKIFNCSNDFDLYSTDSSSYLQSLNIKQ